MENKAYQSIKIKLPSCIGLTKTNKKGKIFKKGLFTWIENWGEFQGYINTIENQIEELKENEKFYQEKLNQLENRITKATHKELSTETEGEVYPEEEIKLLEKEKEYTNTVLKTLRGIEKDTNEMWITTIIKEHGKYKLKRVQKIENIIKKGF